MYFVGDREIADSDRNMYTKGVPNLGWIPWECDHFSFFHFCCVRYTMTSLFVVFISAEAMKRPPWILHRLSLLSFSFCSIKATRSKICKKSVCFYCITTSLWRTPVYPWFIWRYLSNKLKMIANSWRYPEIMEYILNQCVLYLTRHFVWYI